MRRSSALERKPIRCIISIAGRRPGGKPPCFPPPVRQTAGRAITQSRYKQWNSFDEQKNYLENIRNDSMLKDNFQHLDEVKDTLQFDHYILLKLLKNKWFTLIVFLLNIKNAI